MTSELVKKMKAEGFLAAAPKSHKKGWPKKIPRWRAVTTSDIISMRDTNYFNPMTLIMKYYEIKSLALGPDTPIQESPASAEQPGSKRRKLQHQVEVASTTTDDTQELIDLCPPAHNSCGSRRVFNLLSGVPSERSTRGSNVVQNNNTTVDVMARSRPG